MTALAPPGGARVEATGGEAVMSQSRIPSLLAVAMSVPSGRIATPVTGPGCGRGEPAARPIVASQSRAVWSSLPVTTRLPSG